MISSAFSWHFFFAEFWNRLLPLDRTNASEQCFRIIRKVSAAYLHEGRIGLFCPMTASERTFSNIH
jgi:hypothetical protein